MNMRSATRGRRLVALVLAFLLGVAPLTHPTLARGTGNHRTARDQGHAAGGQAAARVGQGPFASQIYFAEGYTGQGPAVNFGEQVAILNTNPLTATGQIDYFLGGITATAPITVPITVPAHAQLTEDVGHDVGPNQVVSALVETDQTISATRTISRTTVAGAPLGESISNGEDGLAQFWYFAEGYTGASFQEYLALFNPGRAPATVTVQPIGLAGSQILPPITATVPARERATINLRAAVPGRSLGLSVQSDQPIAAERVLYWGAGSGSGKYGTAVSSGIRGPAALWTFPYVSTTGSDQVFLSFINPTTVAAHVQLSAYGAAGLAPMPSAITVAAGVRTTVSLPAATGAMAIVASSDVPVIAEEGQYFGGSPNTGTHMGSVLAGTAQPATQWTFPGGGSASFTGQSWYILNRGSASADLTATIYAPSLGQQAPIHFHALAGQLTVVTLPSAQALHGIGVSWTSTGPVVITKVLHGPDPASGAVVAGFHQP